MSVELEMVYVESSEIRESCVMSHADNAEMSFPIWLNVSIVYAERDEISDSIAPYASRSIFATPFGFSLMRYSSLVLTPDRLS